MRRFAKLRAALVIGGVTAVLVSLLGLLFVRARAAENKVALASEPRGVTVATSVAEEYRATRRYVGTLQPWVSARLGPQLVQGFVETVLVRPGAKVTRNEVVATLDCKKSGAQSRTIALEARALEARQSAAASLAARVAKLQAGGFVSASETERTAAESAAAEASLLARRSLLSERSLEAHDCLLRAPFDGEVSERRFDPGAFVRPGDAVLSVIDRRTLRVVFDVPETEHDNVRPGAVVTLRPFTTRAELKATVSRRSPAADPGSRTLRVEIDLASGDQDLPVGTTAEVLVPERTARAATRIPLAGARVRGATATVFVVEGDRVKQLSVPVLGEAGGTLYVGPELPSGARVVVEGRSLLRDGDAVVVKEAGGKAP